eukprot:CAMPEP_0119502018 /NCGR_PEP_ID=MMETSP1344-20130328/23637_1 /TAXON_ID=236787 /ORGANISM="Florenciella parvula, Strain CCMP2471" /LENGTH=52 /DNA_ID=CAMNT_0007538207 /DNA_START=1 /DNA_END=155 /DNA_ORIENTATION=-
MDSETMGECQLYAVGSVNSLFLVLFLLMAFYVVPKLSPETLASNSHIAAVGV